MYFENFWLNDINSMNVVRINENPYYILAILNSKLMSYWFVHKYNKFSRGIFPQFKVNELAEFPIKIGTEKEKEGIATLSKRMIELMSNENKYVKELRAIDDEIDKKIYELYELDKNEVNEIENSYIIIK